MRDQGLIPAAVLCSEARRALETWDLVGPFLGGRSQVKVLRSLYLASPGRLLAALQRLPPEVPSALLLGHNPGLAALAQQLAGPGSKKEARHHLSEKYPTGALAVFRFDIDDWMELAPTAGRLVSFLRPRDLD